MSNDPRHPHLSDGYEGGLPGGDAVATTAPPAAPPADPNAGGGEPPAAVDLDALNVPALRELAAARFPDENFKRANRDALLAKLA